MTITGGEASRYVAAAAIVRKQQFRGSLFLSSRTRFRIIEKNGGKPPLTYHQFQNVVASMEPPEPLVPTVTSACIGGAYTPLKDDHDDHYGVPTLEELGEKRSISPDELKAGSALSN